MRTPMAVALAVAGLLAAPAAASGADVWRGTATGVQDRVRHHDEQTSPNVVWDDQQHYEVELSFSFTIDEQGVISGDGDGRYTAARWHIAGVNEDAANGTPPTDPHFDCAPPISADPFDVLIAGDATADTVTLQLLIPDAAEISEDYDCGADFELFPSASQYMAESLHDVGGDELSFARARPTLRALVADEAIDSDDTTGNAHSTWTIRLTAPAAGGSGGGGGGGGAGGAPTPSGNPPDRSLCTVTGTRRADVLEGTPGPDVICAFGGDDVIRGRGGDDVIYAGSGKDRIRPGGGKDTVSAGPGDDRISARDGKRDRIDGGRGRDRATIDRKLDKVTRVERRA
jgi:Ca2+-binding RTX toxin-like protein